MTTTFPADGPTPSGWSRLLAEWSATAPLVGAQEAEAVVVGAGFTGLAAARRLAGLLPGRRVVLLEAERVGAGPSGRNSGFVVDQPHGGAPAGEDLEASRRVQRLGRAGLDALRGLVAQHGIACDWIEVGRLHGAVAAAGEAELAALARGLDRLGVPVEHLDRGRTAAVLGTGYYRRSLRTPGGAMVQPAALVRGLAASLPSGVSLHEDTPVTRLERLGHRWLVRSARGEVTTRLVLLATDALTRRLGWLRDRLVPVYTYASLTRPLGPERVGGDQAWGLLPAHKAGSTLRRLPDGRLLVRNDFRYGGGFRCTGEHLEAARRRHVAALAARWPALSGEDVESTWGGLVCFTGNFAPSFGRLAEGLFAAAGTNGVGLARGTAAGRLLAELALERRSALLDDLQALPVPPWLPQEPLLGLGVRARLAWAQWSAGPEQ